MEDLHITGSSDVYFVPSVHFSASTGKCEIGGESYLEETVEFYTPLLDWLRQYMEEVKGPIIFDFKLTYFNTSSSRCILDILYLLKEYEEEGGSVLVS